MTPRELRARAWSGAACALAQIAATAAGMVPWWALPVTLALTVAVSRAPGAGPVNLTHARVTRTAGVACVATFSALIAFRAVTLGGIGVDPVSTLRSLSEALVVLSLIMAPSARTPREHRVWLTVTTGVLVAAAAGGHSATSAALSMLSWVVLLIAISKVQTTAAYAGGAVAAQVDGGRQRPPRLSLFGRVEPAVPVGAALLAGALVFLAIPANLGGGGLARRIAHQVSGNSPSTPTTRDQVGVDTYGLGDLSLLVRGQLPDTPIIAVPASSPMLWRGTFYRTYTGNAWQAADGGPLLERDGPDTAVPLLPDDPPARGGQVRRYPVEIEPGIQANLVWSPGVPTHISDPSGRIRFVVRGASHVRAFGLPNQPLTSYTVTSVVAPTSPDLLRASHGADLDDPTWTQLPPTLPAEVATLARRITAGADDRYDQVAAIETYLRSHETYSLSSPVPGPGEDAVDDFLFRDHIGFCEQFASAEAVMLRTLGVPARVVSGLAYGTPVGSRRLYTAANAHAWVEVYYPGIGWSPSDPTAGVPLASTATSHRSALARALSAVADNLPGGRLSLGVIVAMLVVVAAWIVRTLLRGGRSTARGRSGGPPGPVLAAFLRATRHRHGPPPRAPAETAREYLGRIDGPDELAAAVATLEQEVYGATPPDAEATRVAVAAFDALTERAPAR